jgi:O-succinylbenzoic acid--CoA ligase
MEPWLERAASVWPSRVAIESGDGVLTYAELRASVDGFVASPGDRVAIALPFGLDFAVAVHACLWRGAVAMPIDPRLAERERTAQVREAGIVIDAPLVAAPPDIAAPAHVPDPGDPCLVVHTSGTTGSPRPVTLSYGNVLANALGCFASLGHSRSERWLCPLPLSHVGGLMVLLRSVIAGTTAVLDSWRDDVTIASLVPTQLARLLAAGTPPPASLRVVMLGGAPADPTLLARAREAGWPVAPSYGLTQACSAVTVAEPGDLETSGAPLPGLRVSIAPDGEILVEGPTVAGGGVLRTGDLGRLEGGRLIVVGRKSDTIVSGGENVAPTEVEAVLLEHPSVVEAGVVGRPDPEWGEAVTAFVVVRGPVDDLRAFCRERLAAYKVPKTIEVVSSLPRNAAGKLLRVQLRASMEASRTTS